MTENKEKRSHQHRKEEITIGNKKLILLWLNDRSVGYTIELKIIHTETQSEDTLLFSFGTTQKKEDTSYGWGEYLLFKLKDIGSDVDALNEFLDDLGGVDCTYPHFRDFAVIERIVYDHNYQIAYDKHAEKNIGQPRMVIVVGPGGVQNISSDIDLQVHVINNDTEDVDLIETGPVYGEESFIEENLPILVSPESVNRYIGGIQVAKKIHDIRNNKIEEQPYSGAAYMMPLYDGLHVGEIYELLTYLTHIEQMVPIEIYENNTAIIGFKSESVHDNEEITDALRAIAEDWDLQPDDNIVVTSSGLRIALLDRVRNQEGGNN